MANKSGDVLVKVQAPPGEITLSYDTGDSLYHVSAFASVTDIVMVDVNTNIVIVEITFADPDNSGWIDLEEKKVILSDKDTRIKIKITPQLPDLQTIFNALGTELKIKTSGTAPSGQVFTLTSQNTTLVQGSGYSEMRVSLTRHQLKTLGVLLAQAADSVFEKAWFDTGLDDPSAPSNLEDSRAFDAGLSYASRGQCSQVGDLESTPPNSPLDTTFFQAAGREIITANYYNQLSHKRQIMNQADVFYYSGHGSHSSGSLFAGGPADVSGYWDRDLNVVVIAGCAVLDINDYNDNYTDPIEHTRSPGKAWEPIGPGVLLGYNYTAPLDTQNSDSIIVSWLNDRETLGDIDAWKNANNNSHGRNACAIQKDVSYFYFNKILPLIYVWTEVQKGNW